MLVPIRRRVGFSGWQMKLIPSTMARLLFIFERLDPGSSVDWFSLVVVTICGDMKRCACALLFLMCLCC